MSTRELLQLADEQPWYLWQLVEYNRDLETRLKKLRAAGLVVLVKTGTWQEWRLTPDGRDLLHGASERRLSA